jgi:hypothetical protein
MSARIAPLFEAFSGEMAKLLATYDAKELLVINLFVSKSRALIEAQTNMLRLGQVD